MSIIDVNIYIESIYSFWYMIYDVLIYWCQYIFLDDDVWQDEQFTRCPLLMSIYLSSQYTPSDTYTYLLMPIYLFLMTMRDKMSSIIDLNTSFKSIYPPLMLIYLLLMSIYLLFMSICDKMRSTLDIYYCCQYACCDVNCHWQDEQNTWYLWHPEHFAYRLNSVSDIKQFRQKKGENKLIFAQQ